jgi:hypothetical protein
MREFRKGYANISRHELLYWLENRREGLQFDAHK